MQTKPSIVFCHGIWADGSCFNKVIPALQADGYEVMAAQYGLDTNEGDRSLRSSEKHVLRTGRSGFVRRRSTSKIRRSEWILTKKENSHERAY
jgi:hypothetical protein